VIDVFFGIPAETWAEIIRNYVITIVSIFTAWVAWSGVDNWKKQENWKENRILAKGILLNTYKAQQAISDFRNPFMSEAEIANASEDENYDPTDSKKLNAAQQNAYIKRFRVITNVFEELYPLEVEAQVVWGNEISNFIREIQRLVIKLKFAMKDSPTFNSQNPKLNQTKRDEIDKFMLDSGDDDDFSTDVEEIISRINDYLSPYLDRRT